jgi:hypothetical protein
MQESRARLARQGFDGNGEKFGANESEGDERPFPWPTFAVKGKSAACNHVFKTVAV